MKKLELVQMEGVNGSMNGRNCMLAGAGATLGILVGIGTGGLGAAAWYAFGGASWLTGVAGDCF